MTTQEENAELKRRLGVALSALKQVEPVCAAMQRYMIKAGLAEGHTPGGPVTDAVRAAIELVEKPL